MDSSAPAILKYCRTLCEQQQVGEAMSHLRAALSRHQLAPEQMEQAGRLLKQYLPAPCSPWRVRLLGQCTTSWIAQALRAQSFGRGRPLHVEEAEYDNVMQHLLKLQQESSPSLDTAVLLPWCDRLLASGPRGAAKRLEDELDFWRRAWDMLQTHCEARVIQIGYDSPLVGALGYHLASRQEEASLALIRRLNDRLRQALPKQAYFVDLDRLAGQMGRAHFYDARRYFWTRQPFSEPGAAELGRHLAAAVAALTIGPRKVLVLDLDNTLWGGLVGELGPLNVELGESPDGQAYLAFQRYLKQLQRRGVLLAVSSKNNPSDAREPFEKNPQMQLALDDFAVFEASWSPKGRAIEKMAQTLRLGLDSFAFFDDNPAEREQVRQWAPDVAVIEAPLDPADYIAAIENSLWFETVALTEADQQRAVQYVAESKRCETQQAFGAIEDYLTSLEMVGEVRKIDEADLPRVVQLLGKTNQFNLTTKRHSEEAVQCLLAQDGAVGLTLRLRDKFADHGLVGVLLAIPNDSGELAIDSWLISCRVIGRTAEWFFFEQFLEQTQPQGAARVIGQFIPTAKNTVVADLYEQMGLIRQADTSTDVKNYVADLVAVRPPPHFIHAGATVQP